VKVRAYFVGGTRSDCPERLIFESRDNGAAGQLSPLSQLGPAEEIASPLKRRESARAQPKVVNSIQQPPSETGA
jgi:hypothetical protein